MIKIIREEFESYYIVATGNAKTNKEIYREHCKTLEQAEKIYKDIIKSLTSYPRKKGNDTRVGIFKITLDPPQRIKSCVVTPDGVIEESKIRNSRNTSLVEKPVATATKTTGYKERAIALPKDDYHDIWEEGLEELLYDCKDEDDSVEWDIDYHGGMFGDTEVLYLYSYLNTYEEVKRFVQQFRDKVMYESKKRRLKEDSLDDIGFDFKTRYISNVDSQCIYDIIEYLKKLGVRKYDYVEDSQIEFAGELMLQSDVETYKKVLDFIKRNDFYAYR